MKLSSTSFDDARPIPEEFAFARFDPQAHFALSANKNPHLSWSGAPKGTRSFALLCIDTEVPTVGDDVNQEGRTVRADLPRMDFVHWAMVDIPATTTELAAGSCSHGVSARGKRNPPGPPGARQGKNDYTGWFAGDPQMGGTYLGYDGPAPPWNDERVHRYRFEVSALDVERLPVGEAFSASDMQKAIAGHVLASAKLTGTYTLNPELRAKRSP